MSVDWLIELAWKSGVLAASVIAFIALARNRSAAEKSLLGDIGLLAVLILPLSLTLLPNMEMAPPDAIGAAIDDFTQASAQFGEVQAATQVAEAPGIDWRSLGMGMYLAPVILLLGGLINGLLRLGRLLRGAKPLCDPLWMAALAAAQTRTGFCRRPAVMLSDSISSPISWGVFRPVIMVDPITRADVGRAEAIIAHELAHLQRLDWLKLIAARFTIALFWFNPLVWFLARHCHQLREQAADDVALRMRVAKSDYADLLLTTARQANAPRAYAANGVAPGRSSIALRVHHVLHPSKPRRPAAPLWTALVIGLALGANSAVASTHLVIEQEWVVSANARLNALPGGPARADPAAIRPLMRGLRDGDPAVRLTALKGLARMRPTPDPIATPAVSDLLHDPVAEVRAEAAATIGSFSGVRNSRSIEKMLLRDSSAKARLSAALALGRIRDPDSRDTLNRALRDPDDEVRTRARWALAQIGTRQ